MAHFQQETFQFLRGLTRHNNREWFEARRAVYERALKIPMLAVVGEINAALEGFAPEHVRPPHKCMMRIYRDTRFSKDKRPYKTHLSAWWARLGMEKTSGGGFYLQVSPEEVMVAAGVYMPERDQLLAVRRWMAENHLLYRRLVGAAGKVPGTRGGSAALSAAFTAIAPDALTRMPKGFPADHPAGELLRAKNWGVVAHLPAEAALDDGFAKAVAGLFRRANPVVAALNEGILAGGKSAASPARKPLF